MLIFYRIENGGKFLCENWKHLNMMDIYVKIEMIANGFFILIIGKWALNSPNRKLLNYRTEENSSVGKLVIFKL